MKGLVSFFHEIGELRKIPRRGWVLIGAKKPADVIDHSFRLAVMTWILGRGKRFNMERAIKMALVHDLCELYAGDVTPYDHKILPKDKSKWPEMFDRWPRFSKSEKIRIFHKKHKKEKTALTKLTSGLSPGLRKEIFGLWLDYDKGLSKEANFVRQINRLEALLQAFEHAKETKCRPFRSWWVGTEERVDDPFLIEFMLEIAKQFYPKTKK